MDSRSRRSMSGQDSFQPAPPIRSILPSKHRIQPMPFIFLELLNQPTYSILRVFTNYAAFDDQAI